MIYLLILFGLSTDYADYADYFGKGLHTRSKEICQVVFILVSVCFC